MLPQPSPSSPLWFVICWLAVWRLTMLLSFEAGPFDLLSRIRAGLVRIGLQRLIRCFHCLSVWISAIVVLAVYRLEPRSLLILLGVAGAASITERFFGMPAAEEEEVPHA
jgi:hypothetical protein